VRRLLRGHGDAEGLRIGQPNILGCQYHQTPGDEHGIFARLEHPRKPVHTRMGIAVAHRLDERRDDVVVLVAGAVVTQRSPLQRLFDVLARDSGSSGAPGTR